MVKMNSFNYIHWWHKNKSFFLFFQLGPLLLVNISLSPLLCLCWTERRERWESIVEKDHAEGRANDMDVGGPPASVDYRDDRRHERGPAGLSSFEGRVDAGYLLWSRVPSSNLSCTALTLSHSEDRACTHIYENCLVCL